MPVDAPEPSQEFLQMSLENDVSFTPTLSIIQNRWHFAERPELLDDSDLRLAFNQDALARLDDPEIRAEIVNSPGFADQKAQFRQVQDFVKTIHDAGIKVALGNDAGTPNVPFGWGMHHEMELYVEAGAGRMPPVGEADFGTLEAGKVADLIVLNADPLSDIRNTLNIDQVMRLGEWIEREGLLPTP